MRARFQVDVQRSAARPLTGFLDGHNLAVLYAGVGVISAADHFVPLHQHGADHGIGARQRPSSAPMCHLPKHAVTYPAAERMSPMVRSQATSPPSLPPRAIVWFPDRMG